ncbi:hypothetical protein MLD38_010592 [Melastoma candidum]|uniref:Uncharacterized protein n=1 Tax=Melastoma candidum TaxID=119954 RepID=A0ACB9R0W5_9MYRT|nr:hypothetical protein MLD38_010592 [Melastoma candidum]
MEGASAIPVQEPATLPLNPPPPPTQTLPPPPQSDTRKRAFESISGSNLHFTNYVKMRALVHDLRPRFVEVLGSPDFRNCKASGEIREEVKALMDLFKQIIGGQVSADGIPEEQPFTATENGDGQKAHLEHRSPKPAEQQRTEEEKFVVGGSAFGWNFVTVPSSDSVYYGVSKETFRAAQEINNENCIEKEELPRTEAEGGGVDG